MVRTFLLFLCLHVVLFAFDVAKYEKAALKGDVKAMVFLGKIYYNGKELPRDYKKSFYYFSKAVSRGNNHAKVMLSLLYKNGKGTEKNAIMAVKLIEDAAKHGYKFAKEWLASMGDVDAIFQNSIKKRHKELKNIPKKSKILGIVLGEPFRDEIMNIKYNGHSYNDRLRKVFYDVKPLYSSEKTSNIENITLFTSISSNTVYEVHVEYKKCSKTLKNRYFKKLGVSPIKIKSKLFAYGQREKLSYVDFGVGLSPLKKEAFFRVDNIENLEGIRHIVGCNSVVVIDFSALAIAIMESIEENDSYFSGYMAKDIFKNQNYASIFGISFMNSPKSSWNLKEIDTSNRWKMYSVTPPKLNNLFSQYSIKTTFFTDKIYNIRASGKVAGIAGIDRCGNAVNTMLKSFTDSFSNAHSKKLYYDLKDKKFAIFDINENGVTKEYPQSFGSKAISVKLTCTPNSKNEYFINLDMNSYYAKEVSEIENCLLLHNSNIWLSQNCKILVESYIKER